MSYQPKLRPELLDDVAEAFAWYQGRAAGLGHEFLRMYFAAIAGVARNPLLFQVVYADFRRILLRRFPYVLYYRLERDTIVFFLLFHCARNPAVLRCELRNRRETA